jgi:GNAT superfamily N-acetyltransferase
VLAFGENPVMRIRPATSKDEEQIFRLARALATSFEVSREAFCGSFREVLASGSCDVLVAETEQGIVGYVFGLHHPAFYASGEVSWVEEIFVEEPKRRLGIGEQLMAAFERRAEERGSRLVGLATRRAASFYRAIGYEESAAFFRKLLGKVEPGAESNGDGASRL